MSSFRKHPFTRPSIKGNLKVPSRWENYTAIGEVVPGTRFLPFKTPLKEEICRRSLSDNEWFTPAMLLEKAPHVKLIIDLTQTDRFYVGQYFEDNGVRYHKLICPGGGRSVPSSYIVRRFKQLTDDFLASQDGLNKESLIGVHCTHGLNRTGYLICKYMVENCGISGKAAIEAFEEARGHKIERHVYTDDILCHSTAAPPVTQLDLGPPKIEENHRRNRYHAYSDTSQVTSNWRNRSDSTLSDRRRDPYPSSYNWRNRDPRLQNDFHSQAYNYTTSSDRYARNNFNGSV